MAQTYNCVINSCPLSILECNPLEALSALSVREGSSLNISIFILLVLSGLWFWVSPKKASPRRTPGWLQTRGSPDLAPGWVSVSCVTPRMPLSSPVTTLLLSFIPSFADHPIFQHPLSIWDSTAPKVTPPIPQHRNESEGIFPQKTRKNPQIHTQNLWALGWSCQAPEEGCR